VLLPVAACSHSRGGSYEAYRAAALLLWGPSAAWAVDETSRLNVDYFDAQLPPLPVVVGITAYGRCIGLTRHSGAWVDGLPRITIASNQFHRGADHIRDVLLHEMIHAHLILGGLNPHHEGWPWINEITRLSPAVLGREINAKPVYPRRVGGKNVRAPRDGHLSQMEIAGWPGSLRPDSHDPVRGEPLTVASY
jgi:hypothetical protein